MAAISALGRTALQAVPCRWLLTHSWKAPGTCRCSPPRVPPAASLCSARTEKPRTARKEEEEEDEGPEYIPRRKAKNPMRVVGYAWMIGLPTGIISFLLAKRAVDKNRLKQLKIRQRMQRSNQGDYERERYFAQAGR